MSNSLSKISIVVPCYNEEEALHYSAHSLLEILGEFISEKIVSEDSFIVFVDDGSKDRTWSVIEILSESNSLIKGLKLSRNRGHQNALLAGLNWAHQFSDACISIDADLQDDISVMRDFLKKFQEGNDVVYGVRNDREVDSAFKKITARGFYKLMLCLGVEIIDNHADYRLMSKRAIENLFKFNEVNLFLRGIVPLIGYKSEKVYYRRLERVAGVSKYPLFKMLSFALNGITSFSVKPLRIATFLGLIISFSSFATLIFIVISKYLGNVVPGWTSIVLPLFFLGGVQILFLGIIGEYVGKMYLEVKGRPRFIIDKIV